MTGPKISFMALMTRSALTEMLARQYAAAKNVDVNESYGLLEVGLRNSDLIRTIQDEAWYALIRRYRELRK